MLDLHFKYDRPRDLLTRKLVKKYIPENAVVCDVGCGYGHYLIDFSSDSYGIEISDPHLEFAHSLGLKAFKRNVIHDDLSDLPKADVVFASACIEHTESPHVFLRKLQCLLKDDGIVVLETSSRPIAKWFRHIPMLRPLYEEHGDHISFFTPDAFKMYASRAGFDTVDCFMWSAPIVNRFKKINPLLTRRFPFNLLACDLVYVGRKNKDWEYPSRSSRKAANNTCGFEYK